MRASHEFWEEGARTGAKGMALHFQGLVLLATRRVPRPVRAGRLRLRLRVHVCGLYVVVLHYQSQEPGVLEVAVVSQARAGGAGKVQ